MNHFAICSLLLASTGLVACQKAPEPAPPTVVVVPGPTGATGATGATGDTGNTGAQGQAGKPADGGTTVIVVPPAAASAPAN